MGWSTPVSILTNFAFKPTGTTRTSSTHLPDPDLQLSGLIAGHNYLVSFFFANSGVAGVLWNFGGSAVDASSGAFGLLNTPAATLTFTGPNWNVASITAATNTVTYVTGTILVAAAGSTLNFSWGSTNGTVLAGGYLWAIRAN